LLGATPLFLAYLAFPVCTAVAVLRHRLFDIDLIVNRALVVTLATALVAAGYVLVVVVVGLAVGEGTGGFWPSLLATAVVAMAFQPLRRRVVRLADRLAFGASAAPYEALADFSRRVGESPDPSRLLPALAEAAGTAVNARRATARLPIPGGTDHVATWPAVATQRGAGTQVDVPVVDRGEPLGTLSVELPAGRDLRPDETRLLQDLADQASIAFRNARLSAELAERVEQLDRHTAELAESRRRLITAGDAERSRLERRIAQEVAPHLRPLPVRLEELAHATNGALPTSQLPPLVASSAAALEALREITRGVFPAQLSRVGLEPALGSLLGRSGGRLVTEPSASGRRFDHRLEAATYFCVAEAVRDMSAAVEVVLRVEDDELRLQISGCEPGRLADDAMRDRVETVGGTVTHRTVDGATVLDVRVPAQVPARALS
jgi:GAF domain-containing protein